jgi:hypothetical protein
LANTATGTTRRHLHVPGDRIHDPRVGRKRDLQRLGKVVLAVAIVNGGVSIATFVLVNVLHVFPKAMFFLNERYPVILFPIGGESWVRVPGIFESGGSNGTFWLITGTLSGAYSLFGLTRAKRRLLWILLAGIQGLLIIITLTRRSILALAVASVALAVIAMFQRRRYEYVVLSLLVVAGTAVAVYGAAPELFDARNWFARLAFWERTVNHLMAQSMWRPFVGFGLVQAGLDFLPQLTKFTAVDNAFVGLLFYGGVAYATFVIIALILLFATNVRLLSTTAERWRWLAIANVVMLLNLFVRAWLMGCFPEATACDSWRRAGSIPRIKLSWHVSGRCKWGG